MNSPIDYVIGVAKLRALESGYAPEEKKQHLLVCNMAGEDLARYEAIEIAAFQFIFAREKGMPLEDYYQQLCESIGIEIEKL